MNSNNPDPINTIYDCSMNDSVPSNFWKTVPNAMYVPRDVAQKLMDNTKAVKYDQDKPPMNLLSNMALTEIAKVMQFGAKKYEAHNWRKGFDWSRPLAAAMRHINAFNDGEDTDPESGLSHLAHAGCCIMFLLEFEKTHKELDDRYKVTKNV